MQRIIETTVEVIKHLGPISGFLLIILESIFPILPLGVFIALNIFAFGSCWGFIISYVATIIGSLMSFFFFRKNFSSRLYKRAKERGKLDGIMKVISKMSFGKLVLIIALPFTPAFLINIAAGLSKIKTKNFIFGIILGKISIVYFWGYIGTSLIESITDPLICLKIIVVLTISFLASKCIAKFYNIY